MIKRNETRQVSSRGEFALVSADNVTHVWLTRAYLENEHPVMDSLQIPNEKIQVIIAMLEERQVLLDHLDELKQPPF